MTHYFSNLNVTTLSSGLFCSWSTIIRNLKFLIPWQYFSCFLSFYFQFYWIFSVFTFQMFYPPPLPSVLPLNLFPWRCSLSQSPTQPQCLGWWWCCSSHEGANLSAISVLSLAFSLGSLSSVWCLAASILICIYMTLGEPLKRHPCLVPANKHFLTSAIVHGFGPCIWGGSPGEAVSIDLFFNPYSSIWPCISSPVLLSFLRRTKASTFLSSFFVSFISSVDS